MQTLIVTYRTGDRLGRYPALRGKRLSKAVVQRKLDHLRSCQWDITEHTIHEDGMSRAEDDRQFRAMWRSERRRAA